MSWWSVIAHLRIRFVCYIIKQPAISQLKTEFADKFKICMAFWGMKERGKHRVLFSQVVHVFSFYPKRQGIVLANHCKYL